MEVTLSQMLEAREQRAFRQMKLLRTYGLPIVSFSLNIPGPVKDSPLIRRGFDSGLLALNQGLPKAAVREKQILRQITGCEAIYVVDMDPVTLKRITTAIEDDHGLGRLFDMDVIGPDLQKLDREKVGGGSRNCIVCGAPGRSCASRRLHTVEQLQQKVREILSDYYKERDREQIGSWAVQSLLDEVCTTPKPGLVDHRNSGSHRDMDIFTFIASASALAPYFEACVRIGQDTAGEAPEETFRQLRRAGIQAEQTMLAATSGVNTHKGAIFTMGLLCGSAGRLWDPAESREPEALTREVSRMTREILSRELPGLGTDTAGERLYHSSGISGIRGEATEGLPSVVSLGLPVYRDLKKRGMDRNLAGAVTLLHLIGGVTDTNMLARGGAQGARLGAEGAAALVRDGRIPELREIQDLDDRFIERNLSPGGCADLLAAVYFLDHFGK